MFWSQDKNKCQHDRPSVHNIITLPLDVIRSSFLLGVDDLGQAVSPHAALCLGTGLQHTLFPRLQRPHPQTRPKLLGRDTQQLGSSLPKV